MSKYKKYVTGGGVNPFWILEHLEKSEARKCCNSSRNDNKNSGINVSININFGSDGLNGSVNFSKSKPVLQYDKNGNFLKEWLGIKNAGENLKIASSEIGECCRGKRKTAGGYAWKFKEMEEIL